MKSINPGCSECHRKDRMITSIKAEEQILRKFKGDKTNYDYSRIKYSYIGYNKLVEIICPTHGIFKQNYASLIQRPIGSISCPNCRAEIWFGSNISKSESLCKSIVEVIVGESNVDYCKKIQNTSNLVSRDFFVPDIYIPVNIMIEYNGEQHYKFTKFFHKSLSDFIDQVNRDLLLREYCKDNNIKLLEIPYLDDGRLEEVIRDFILRGINSTTPCHPSLPIIKYDG